MDAASKMSDSTLTPWLDMASDGAVILTSNQRAARYLLQQHVALARSRGLVGWATPQIVLWDAWLSKLWQDVVLADPSAPVLVTSAQEHELWRAAVRSFDAATQWNEAALATLAQQAWQLLQRYTEGLASLGRHHLFRPDWQQFQKWATKFSTDNRRNGWLPQAQLCRELEVRLGQNQWQPPAQLILWGFDEFTPAQQRLLDPVKAASSVHIVHPSVDAEPATGRSFTFTSQTDELEAVAAWARKRLHTDTAARLAIITTKVGEDRGLIYRTLTSGPEIGDFNFSLGHPLFHTPLVRTALTLLRWIWQPLPPQEVSALLQSPSLYRSYESLLQLAEFDSDVFLTRDAADSSTTLEQFTRWLQSALARTNTALVADLLSRCQKVLRLRSRRDSDPADKWAERFHKILETFQFPSPLASSSADFQTFQRWSQLLDEFSTLSFNRATFSAQEALERLEQIANQTIFQPESTPANIEILGPLEASGSLFHGIFFISCTEDRWPLPASPNPLLPLDLQQAHAMPGAIRGANVTAAGKMTERLLRSAPEVNFSFPAHGPDGEIRPSAVLASLGIDPSPRALENDRALAAVRSKSELIATDDVLPRPWQFTRGHLSVAALRSQAACPFQAFANQRLEVRDLREPEDGLDALQRGNLLHDLLHDVWLDTPLLPGLKTSAGLRRIVEDGKLENFVEERAAALIHLPEFSSWDREFLIAERERVSSLVCRWLTEVELLRAPFEVVEAEAKREIAIENLVQLRVRLDRLDKLVPSEQPSSTPQDEYVLIDYKTGKVELKGWQTPRLDEPQLPIYADYAVPAQPAAIAFGSISASHEMCFKGLANRGGILPHVEPDRGPLRTVSFAEMLADWHADILRLAGEFAAGEARVSPKHGAETCKYCGLQPLCRVAETGYLLRDDLDLEPHD